MTRPFRRLLAPLILLSLGLPSVACARPGSEAQPPPAARPGPDAGAQETFADGASPSVERMIEDTLTPVPPVGPADAVVEEGQSWVLEPLRGSPAAADMTIVSATAPQNGVLRIDHGQRLIYQPRAGFRGRDRFTYTLADGEGSQVLSPVLIQVVAAPPRPRADEFEIIPRRFSASSAYSGYGGLNSARGLRDGVYDRADSMHGTRSDGDEWIMADLGEVRRVSRVLIACAAATAPGGWGCNYTNTAVLEVSSDGVRWRRVGSVDGAAEDAPVSFDLGGEPIRQIRLSRSHAYLAVGDFRVFGPAGTRRR